VNGLKATGHDSLVVDGGNLFFYKSRLKPFEKSQFLVKARVIVEAYNAIGVAAIALGPYDFAAGFGSLLELRHLAAFPFLCANLLNRQTGEPVFQPYLVVEKADHKIGLIGLLDSSGDMPWLSSRSETYRLEANYASVKRYAKELDEQGCDFIAVLSSVPPKKFRLLAKNIPQVDLYIAGDPKNKLRIPWKIGSAMVANASQLGKYLGHVSVDFDPRDRRRPETKHHVVPMKPEYPDDPSVKRIVDHYFNYVAMVKLKQPQQYVEEQEQKVNLKYGHAVYVSADDCKKCHPEQYEKWLETRHARAFGDLPAENRSRIECVGCHVTGFGRWGGTFGDGKEPDLAGVQCEACHGPGSLHPASSAFRDREALTKACRSCHTRSRSPDFKLTSYLRQIACTPVE
jgi:hypothetical protein